MPAVILSVLFWVAVAVWFTYARRRILKHMLFFQIEEYDNARFANLLWRNLDRVITPVEIGLIVFLVGMYLLLSWLSPATWHVALAVVLCGGWLAVYAGLLIFQKPRPTRKSLVLTARATRLVATGYALTVGILLLIIWRTSAGSFLPVPIRPNSWELPAIIAGALVINQIIGLIIMAANLVMYPVEASFRRHFVRSAKRIFRSHPNLQVIAVTGSYGKTSTKEIIAHILSARYCVLKTPRSFNTVMGICRVIRESLAPDHEIFVVEMGAYKKGEIKALCQLTPPNIGVLTAIGPQHLERFKTLERVAEAKYELMEHLPPNGRAIFNGDDPYCRKLAERSAPFIVRRYGLDPANDGLNVWAERVGVSPQGTEFDLHTVEGPSIHIITQLLGHHNVSNILAAASVAVECGMTLQEIAGAINSLEPVEHRLQKIQGAGGVTVIDDAYNANPAGVQVALEVLHQLPGEQKILVTPGMVELGEREEAEHRQMGMLAADVCDYVILVGAKRTRAIAEGLRKKDFPIDRLMVVQNLDEATQCLQTFVGPTDVVLFENDLPDTYAVDTIYF